MGVEKKRFIIVVLMLMLFGTTATVFSYTYENNKSFNFDLPHNHDNGTAKAGIKTTDRDYGKIQVTYIGGSSDGINCWFRSQKSDGTWDPLNSKLQSITSLGTYHMYYTNSSTGYTIPHSTGTSVQLRMENKTQTIWTKDNVKGIVWFN